MAFLDCFKEEINVHVKIIGPSGVIGRNPDNTPVYDDVIKYDDKGAFWQLSSNEKYECSKIGYPATHNIVLYPNAEIVPISAGDIAIIDEKEYIIYPGGDILDQGEILLYKIGIKDDNN